MATYDVGLKIGIEGDASFNNQLKLINQQTKELNAEMKNVTSAFDKTDRSEAKLSATAAVLTKQIENQGAKVKLLKQKLSEQEKELEKIGTEYQKVVAEEGENSAAAQKLANDYAKQSTAISRTRTDLNNAETEYNQAANALDHLGDEAEETGNQLGGSFARDVAAATVVMGKMVDVAIEIAKEVVEVGKKAVKYNSQMESYSKTIEAFFKTSGQSAEEAAANTAELMQNQKDLAAQIGIGSDKLIDANKMLIAAGIDGQKSQKAVSALAKAVVAVGGGNEELSRMASNLQQIQSVGKASSADMKQFSMAGVDVYGLMAETTGKTVDQLKEMDITFDMIVEALDHATQEGGKFFEASQVGAATLQGQMNLLESTINEKLGQAFEPVNEALREKLIPAAISLIQDIDWNAIGNAITFAVDCVTEFVNAVDEFRAWYDSVYGEPAQETIDAFTASQEDLNEAFLRTGGNIQVFDKDMAGAVEAVKGHGNHMVMEFDGMEQSVVSSVQETAGEVKNILIDQGWEMMQQGETNAYMLGEGIANGSISAESETKTMMDTIMEEVNKRSEAEQYGADFVSGFATGMHRNNGLLANAAKKLAEIVKEYLHFSRPDVGPLRDYENWMPDFVEGLADTMKASEWKLADAAEGLASTITNNAVTNNISMSVYGSSGQDPNQLADLVMVRIQEATNRRNAVWA